MNTNWPSLLDEIKRTEIRLIAAEEDRNWPLVTEMEDLMRTLLDEHYGVVEP